MKVFKTPRDMQDWSEEERRQGETLSLVPTMGYFHDGHLSLMKKGRELASRLVVSLFVNPTQFGANEDLDAYPSNIQRDLALAEAEGTSAVFLPSRDVMYPQGYQTYVELGSLPAHLCGLSRPVHFRGVATVVTKLFNIVQPHTAIFGSKDFQQLQVIRRMTADLNMNIRIVGCPIVREADGLAMSSRNSYLTPEERRSALCLSRSLDKAETLVRNGEKNSTVIGKALRDFIDSVAFTEIDYISLCDPESLEEVAEVSSPVLLALAVKVGKTRLIDNRVIVF
jgi:pantoate--beta-alanine ligase